MSETYDAPPPAPGAAPLTEEAFLADRQSFWGSFTGSVTAAASGIAVLLILLAIFLV